MNKFWKSTIVYFIAIFALELIYKTQVLGVFINDGLFFTMLFSLLYASIISFIVSVVPKKVSTPLMITIMSIVTVIFIGEALFTYIIGSTFSVYSLNLAGQALDFTKIIMNSVIEKWFVMILFLIPLVLLIILRKKFIYYEDIKTSWKTIIICILIYIVTGFSLFLDKTGVYSAYNLYNNTHAPTIMVNKLGLLTEFRIDIERWALGFEEKPIIEKKNTKEKIIEIPEKDKNRIEYNKLDLSFDSVDENTKNYLMNRPASAKNDYTGIFEGKNLIYILAEGFNEIAVDKTLTPTLYKLVNNGFVFTNYYSPVFMSTTGGEFQFTTSLIPTQKSLNEWKKPTANFTYSIGNVFNKLGYHVHAFHDWTYTYYRRNITMKTLGFDNYVGCKNGLEKKMNCNIWPPSDIEMIDSTINDYINEDHFAVYYVTVSGHAEYNFMGNNIAAKNKSLVKDLEYSDALKAYLATQIELDRALEKLLQHLMEKGKLNDTVIVLSGDHYPYTLSVDQMNERSNYDKDIVFEVNKSNLILYNSATQSETINKLACSVDVLPTILNMFNVKYDSRLLIGTDIMSEHDSLVIFNDFSWISEKGRYSTRTGKFIPNEETEVEEDYVSKINREVKNRINVSDNIVLNNYYEKILKEEANN